MSAIGQRNKLRVVREASPGLYLDGGSLGEILLPGQYIPQGTKPGGTLDVFIYRDSEDRLVATTEIPYAVVGEFALLRVVGTDGKIGAFLDWGLPKDLLLPLREQEERVKRGEWVIAYVFLDRRTERIAASTRLDEHLDLAPPPYRSRQAVSLLIAGETPLGYKAIVENAHWGLLYRSELAGSLQVGERLEGYVRTVRPDGKIDLSPNAAGYSRVAPLKEKILAALRDSGGILPLSDNSSPEEIRTAFHVSKKAFKQALGALYRERAIRLSDTGIELVNPKR